MLIVHLVQSFLSLLAGIEAYLKENKSDRTARRQEEPREENAKRTCIELTS